MHGHHFQMVFAGLAPQVHPQGCAVLFRDKLRLLSPSELRLVKASRDATIVPPVNVATYIRRYLLWSPRPTGSEIEVFDIQRLKRELFAAIPSDAIFAEICAGHVFCARRQQFGTCLFYNFNQAWGISTLWSMSLETCLENAHPGEGETCLRAMMYHQDFRW
jgi:hypothetical protein